MITTFIRSYLFVPNGDYRYNHPVAGKQKNKTK